MYTRNSENRLKYKILIKFVELLWIFNARAYKIT